MRILVAVFLVANIVWFSAASLATTPVTSFQVTAIVQNTCTTTIMPLTSGSPLDPKTAAKTVCRYGKAYSTRAEPAAAAAAVAVDKSAPQTSGIPVIVTVTY